MAICRTYESFFSLGAGAEPNETLQPLQKRVFFSYPRDVMGFEEPDPDSGSTSDVVVAAEVAAAALASSAEP